MSLPRIAVDAMGGDEGVRVMVEGAALARRRHDKFKFLLVGDEARIKAALEITPTCAPRPRSSIATMWWAATTSRARRCAAPRPLDGLAINAVKPAMPAPRSAPATPAR
jgi:phosphate acyltransferase